MTKISAAMGLLLISGCFQAAAAETGSAAQPSADARRSTSAAAAPKESILDNFFYGGYINLSLGSYKVIGIEPMLGYRVTPKLAVGVKVRYDYIEDDRYAVSYTTSTYGGSVFARYLVTPKAYVQIEPATYNYEYFYLNGTSEREWVPMLLMGGGFIQPLSERTWLNVQILFDVLQDDQSPYDAWEPFFSIGVGAGF